MTPLLRRRSSHVMSSSQETPQLSPQRDPNSGSSRWPWCGAQPPSTPPPRGTLTPVAEEESQGMKFFYRPSTTATDSSTHHTSGVSEAFHFQRVASQGSSIPPSRNTGIAPASRLTPDNETRQMRPVPKDPFFQNAGPDSTPPRHRPVYPSVSSPAEQTQRRRAAPVEKETWNTSLSHSSHSQHSSASNRSRSVSWHVKLEEPLPPHKHPSTVALLDKPSPRTDVAYTRTRESAAAGPRHYAPGCWGWHQSKAMIPGARPPRPRPGDEEEEASNHLLHRAPYAPRRRLEGEQSSWTSHSRSASVSLLDEAASQDYPPTPVGRGMFTGLSAIPIPEEVFTTNITRSTRKRRDAPAAGCTPTQPLRREDSLVPASSDEQGEENSRHYGFQPQWHLIGTVRSTMMGVLRVHVVTTTKHGRTTKAGSIRWALASTHQALVMRLEQIEDVFVTAVELNEVNKGVTSTMCDRYSALTIRFARSVRPQQVTFGFRKPGDAHRLRLLLQQSRRS